MKVSLMDRAKRYRLNYLISPPELGGGVGGFWGGLGLVGGGGGVISSRGERFRQAPSYR